MTGSRAGVGLGQQYLGPGVWAFALVNRSQGQEECSRDEQEAEEMPHAQWAEAWNEAQCVQEAPPSSES